MRQGQNSKRSRGRGSGRRNVPPRHQTFDSNGPSVRIRGNAYQVHEKYLALARDAGSAGDRIAAENYLQHAEHYFRIINMENDGDSQGRGRGQQNGAGGRGERPRDGSDGPDASAESARAGAAEGSAPAVEAETAQPNGADAQAEPVVSEPDSAAARAPKRKATRGNGKGRRTRAATKAGESGDESASSGPNGADAGEGNTPPSDE